MLYRIRKRNANHCIPQKKLWFSADIQERDRWITIDWMQSACPICLQSIKVCCENVFQCRIQRFLTVATIFSAKRAFWRGWRTILFALSVDARWIESLQILWIHRSIHNSCRMESMCTPTTTLIEKSCISYSLITARYTFKLEPLPDYSGEVQPSDASKCVILREWVKREIEVRW